MKRLEATMESPRLFVPFRGGVRPGYCCVAELRTGGDPDAQLVHVRSDSRLS